MDHLSNLGFTACAIQEIQKLTCEYFVSFESGSLKPWICVVQARDQNFVDLMHREGVVVEFLKNQVNCYS
jgi:hypothetical protein